ncbi:hypothetical protein QUA40_01180 [Microcoleus sp. Pol11C3]
MQQFILTTYLKLNLAIEPIAAASRDTQHQVKLDLSDQVDRVNNRTDQVNPAEVQTLSTGFSYC